VGEETVNVGVAEYYVTHNPHVLASYGLGSCVGVAIYDERRKIGGMAHIMLPDSKAISKPGGPGRYADTAVRAVVEEMEKLGSRRRDMRAKMAGEHACSPSPAQPTPGTSRAPPWGCR